jgi:hypothetical protein
MGAAKVLRSGAWALVLVACTGTPVIETIGGGPTRPPGSRPPKADLSRTDVSWVADHPLRPGRNATWCVTAPAAWKALARRLGAQGDLDLGPPAPAPFVASLNGAAVALADVGDVRVETFADAGDGYEERLRAKAMSLGIETLAPPLPGSTDVVAAFASLRRDLPFDVPFRVHPGRLAFAGGPGRVVTFGLVLEDESSASRRMAEQVRYHAAPEVGFAVVLLPRDPSERIVLGSIARPATLSAGWEVLSRMTEGPEQALHPGTQLVVPKVDFRAESWAEEVRGAPILNVAGGARYVMGTLQQHLELTLSEEGARLVSVSMARAESVGPQPERPPSIVFDRPFLLALQRAGARSPYFLAWFENDDLFVREESRRVHER